MRFYACLFVVCSFGLSADSDFSAVLRNVDNSQNIGTEQLIQLAKTLDSEDAWAATMESGPYNIVDGNNLVEVGLEFQQPTSTKLSKGIWWNSNDYSVVLQFGTKGDLFELPSGATMVLGMFDFDKRPDSRPMMVFGAARNGMEFNDLVNSDPNLISFLRTEVNWLEYVANSVENTDHPLHGLTQAERDIMVERTQFRDGGMAGTYLGIFRTKLTIKQYKDAMRDFGLDLKYISMKPEGGYDDRECEKRATCAPLNNYICTSNC